MTYDPKQVKKGVGHNAMSKIAIINLIVFVMVSSNLVLKFAHKTSMVNLVSSHKKIKRRLTMSGRLSNTQTPWTDNDS